MAINIKSNSSISGGSNINISDGAVSIFKKRAFTAISMKNTPYFLACHSYVSMSFERGPNNLCALRFYRINKPN